jgi:HK97 family phage major capsid protein
MPKETKMAPARRDSDALMATFAAFKAENDARLAALEQGRRDPLTDEKIDRIDRALTEQKAAIDRLALSQRRPALGGDDGQGAHRAAWNAYLRRGDETALNQIEVKALSAGSNPDGGYVAPPELDRLIDQRLREVSPMRAIATVRTTGATIFRKPVSTTHAATGWASETGARVETASPTLAAIDFPAGELYANLAATQTLLDDAYVNVEEWIAQEVEQAFAAQERAAFVSGNGTNRPKGFLASTIVAEASHAWDKLGYIASGAAGAFAASNPADRLLDLVYAPRAEFRQNGRFVMNRKTVSAVRKLKDAEGRYLWQPETQSPGATILGYPVTEIEDMPDIAADAYAVAFGDFARGYLIVDRAGVRVLRDPYTAKPYVLFYVTKRVGGGVQNFDAIKLMKFAVS